MYDWRMTTNFDMNSFLVVWKCLSKKSLTVYWVNTFLSDTAIKWGSMLINEQLNVRNNFFLLYSSVFILSWIISTVSLKYRTSISRAFSRISLSSTYTRAVVIFVKHTETYYSRKIKLEIVLRDSLLFKQIYIKGNLIASPSTLARGLMCSFGLTCFSVIIGKN